MISFNKWYYNIPKVIGHLFSEEISRGTIFKSIKQSLKSKNFILAENDTLSDLLEKQAGTSYKPFMYYENQTISFKEANNSTNQIGHLLNSLGFKENDGVGIMMSNCPEFLYSFYAIQRTGMYFVPINSALKGDSLEYIINHSKIKLIIIDQEFTKELSTIRDKLTHLEQVLINGKDDLTHSLDSYKELPKKKNTAWKINPNSVSSILYTSGTTGPAKGVVLKNDTQIVRRLGLLNHLIYNQDDVIFTCLPLFHVNALFLSFSASLWLGIPIVLEKKFSASKFWSQVNKHNATVLNTIGSMIPILLKNKTSVADKNNSIRLILSAACPANLWETFEKRFNLKIWECYSAVDGGQNYIFNMGNAPVGSIGKISKSRYKIINSDEKECDAFMPGELWFKVKGKKQVVEYFNDSAATKNKVNNGYLKTGDIVYSDQKGYLYFVGRKTESMRVKGENVSAYEVETTLQTHPKIMECAVYGVPSELAEDEIMCSIVLVEGQELDPNELKLWSSEKLARFAVPRYIRFLPELPKTSTHKIIKQSLINDGVTPDTIDLGGK